MDLGVKWDRSIIFVWTLIQKDLQKEEYIWRHEHQLRDVPKGINLLCNIIIADQSMDPKYSRYALSNKSYLPGDEVAYKKYVKAVVERYDGDSINDFIGLKVPVKYWQVDNEPRGDLKDYASFLKMTYEAIREADEDARVLIGGVQGMPPVSRYIEHFDKHYLPILDELSKFEKSYFDIFDFHWYGNATGDYLGIKEVYLHIEKKLKERNLMPLYGFWITEMGTYSGDPDPVPQLDFIDFPFQTERQQAIDLVKRFVFSLSLGIKKIFMAFGITEGFKYDEGYFDFTGLIYDGQYDYDKGRGVKKISYYTYKKMVEVLENADWDNIKTIRENDGIHIYRFVKNNRPIWVAWNDNSESKKISLTLDSGIKKVEITEFVPNYKTGYDIRDYDTSFVDVKGEISEGSPFMLNFELGEVPLFVKEKQ
ncbi:hypothetical protein [Desulfamplus magnetovallimortis]|uniref:hypothetical protein n=1 Tax=Desulfamplus magnetovallimortis TaxID=1246637 RepID=UPI001118FD90|nr:hypothetical protein [Desulfamplus magnetovallimortis]